MFVYEGTHQLFHTGDPFTNPLDLKFCNCENVTVTINGKEFELPMEWPANNKGGANLFYEIVRTMGPREPIGKFFVERHMLYEGFFVVPLDTTLSRCLNESVISVPPDTHSLVTCTVKFKSGLVVDTDLCLLIVHSAALEIDQYNRVAVDLA